MKSKVLRRSGWALTVLATSVGIAACGSSDSSTPSTAKDSAAKDPGAKVDVAAAHALIAPYIGKPSAFPVDRPLTKPLPPGTKITYLQCSTPVCAIFSGIFGDAVKAIGGKLTVVKASASSEALQTAFSSALEGKPDGMLIPAIEPSSVRPQFDAAKKAGVPISTNGIMNGEKFGIGAQQLGLPQAQLAGRLLAAWVVDRQKADAKPVFYTTPELSFGEPIRASFEQEMGKLCAACKVRFVPIPVATIGTAAPARVVSDLQANPDTSVAVFSTGEASTGVPTAMKTAGLKTDIIGFAPNPANLQDIKSGAATAGLGFDLPVTAWTSVDALARLILKEPLTEGEKSTVAPMQFLTAKDLTFDVSKGWTGYPDFPARFAKYWKAG